jgi:glycosyltransferase involved in cell wall biosynthesis
VPIVLGNWTLAAAERASVDMYLPVSHATAAHNGLVGSSLPYEVVPNFVPDDVTHPRGDSAPYLAQLPAPGYLLFVGNLDRYKGTQVLLEAYAGLADAPPLVLIGKRSTETPNELPPQVVMLHDWPHHAIMEAWARCSVALAPSIWPEPCATVVLEAMAVGRPVIATNIGGMPDMIVDGETGMLVPPGDSAALRQALAALLADPQRLERYGAAGKQRIVQFQASAVVQRIESIYTDVLQKHVAEHPRPSRLTVDE